MFVNHPSHPEYGCNPATGEIKLKTKITKGNLHASGYYYVGIDRKRYCVHRFIWECVNGVIDDDRVIDHINNNKTDNRIENLQLVTQQQNCKKSAKNRDYSFAKDNHKNKRNVIVINEETKEETTYKSLYACAKATGVNCGIISMCCQGINRVKSGTSKTTGQKFSFKYIDV